MADPNALASYRRGLARRGEPVIFRRINGQAPNVGEFDAPVTAIVMNYHAQSPVAPIKPEGAVTLGARDIIVLAADLAAKNFPLPLRKNDKVLVRGEWLNIENADPSKRSIAGAIDVVAMGV